MKLWQGGKAMAQRISSHLIFVVRNVRQIIIHKNEQCAKSIVFIDFVNITLAESLKLDAIMNWLLARVTLGVVARAASEVMYVIADVHLFFF